MNNFKAAVFFVFAGSLFVSSGPIAAKEHIARFAGMTAHVFLENSGRFSGPIGRIKGFITWNFSVIGAGIPQGERFSSVLLKIAFRTKGEVFAKGVQAVITVKEKGRKRVRRYRLKDIYVGPGGRVYHAVMVTGIGCLPLRIAVRSHARTYRRTLEFSCGE